MSEWISVKDKLPEKEGKYEVLCDDTKCPPGDRIWFDNNIILEANFEIIRSHNQKPLISWYWENGDDYISLNHFITHWRESAK